MATSRTRARKWMATSMLIVSVAISLAAGKEANEGAISSVPDVSAMDIYDCIGISIMVFALALAAAGGIGGAMIVVPTMVLVMGFDIKAATPIANLGIFGGGIANAVFNMRKRHPAADRPLIDPDVVLIMIPAIIGGVVVGTVFANLLPSYLLSLLMAVVVSAASCRMVVKAIAMMKLESAAKKKQAMMSRTDAENPTAPSPTVYYLDPAISPSTSSTTHTRNGNAQTSSEPSDLAEASLALAQIIEQERHFNWKKHASVFSCYVLIVAGSIAGALVRCGSAEYWVILAAEVPCIVIFEFFAARLLLKEYELKVRLNYPFLDGDVRWSKKTLFMFAPACVAAGVVSGTFGVGAAAITSPILIEMGVIPEVLAAMSALMILYSSGAATAKFALFDMVKWDWAVLVFALSLVVTSLSQYFILGFVRRSGRQSIILLCMLASIYIGAALMLYDGVKLTLEQSGSSFDVDVCS